MRVAVRSLVVDATRARPWDVCSFICRARTWLLWWMPTHDKKKIEREMHAVCPGRTDGPDVSKQGELLMGGPWRDSWSRHQFPRGCGHFADSVPVRVEREGHLRTKTKQKQKQKSIQSIKNTFQKNWLAINKTKTNIERIIINPAYSSIKHKCCIIVHGWIKRTIQKTLGPLCLLLARSWPCCIWRNRRALKAKCNEPLLQSCRYIYNLSSIVTHFGRMNSWITTRV